MRALVGMDSCRAVLRGEWCDVGGALLGLGSQTGWLDAEQGHDHCDSQQGTEPSPDHG
jgi:hypothetical protein